MLLQFTNLLQCLRPTVGLSKTQTTVVLAMAAGSFKTLLLLLLSLNPKLILLTVALLRLECLSYANFNVALEGLVDSGDIIKEIDAKSRKQCVLECMSSAKCVAVNYHINGGKCQLLDRGFRNSTSALVKKAGWVYMTSDDAKRDVGPTCMKLSPCFKGKCVDTCGAKGFQCICDPFWYGTFCDKVIQDCRGVYESGKTQNGIYTIYLAHSDITMDVYCDMTAGHNKRWIVIQRRVDNSVDFYRNWKAYKDGFGSLSGNMWFGLDKIHILAGPNRRAKLRVDVKHRELGSTTYHAKYRIFEIDNEAEKYKLLIDGYSGNAGNAMAAHNKMKFSTFDSDNDVRGDENCAVKFKGAWWYTGCHHANLNGLFPTVSIKSAEYMSWLQLHSSYGNIVYSEMKINYD